ncbi:MFS transporter [Candidatus Poribacteria bacterium]
METPPNKEKKNLLVFLISQFCNNLNFAMWRSVYNNFLHERFSVTEFQRGYLAAIREAPGLVPVLFTAGITSLAETNIAGIYMLITGLGTLAFVFADRFWSLILALLLMSGGMHLAMPLRSSISLRLGKEGAKAKWLGQIGSVNAAAALAGSGLVALLIGVLKYNGVFIVASVVSVIATIAMLLVRLGDKGDVGRSRFAIKRKYSLYYTLNFLDACRRHIFVTFAAYGLVKIHGVNTQTIAILIFINNGINIYTRQMMGGLIDRFGERRILMFNYSVLIFIFLGYAYVVYIPLLYVLYCLDNVLFGFSMAKTTYLDKIAPREDITASIAFGITLNHISAVSLLPTAGYLWGRYGYETPFLIGVCILFLSIFVSSRIRIPERS